MASKRIDLGFVNDDCDPRLLESRYFPSKVGGKPAWLSLKPLPPTERLSCSKCSKQLAFLMQVYSPRDKPEDDAFHRTLFLFVCRNPGCCLANNADNFVVLRSQLPLINQFFGPDPPPDDPSEEDHQDEAHSASKYQPLCVVCGCLGSKKCSQCHSVNYCGKDHQTCHWKAGHKKTCGKSVPQESEVVSGVVFPELELEIEEEDYTPDKTVKDEEEALQEYQQCVGSTVTSSQSTTAQGAHYSEQELDGMATQETEDDKQFRRFQKRVACNQDQVLRYCKGGEPLWVSISHQVTAADIPDCSCGAPRQFEFQVMPQLLNHLGMDEDQNSLDWGTLCVYTCQDSCSIGNKYVTEFIHKQDFTA